jgi:hypothetical protein
LVFRKIEWRKNIARAGSPASRPSANYPPVETADYRCFSVVFRQFERAMRGDWKARDRLGIEARRICEHIRGICCRAMLPPAANQGVRDFIARYSAGQRMTQSPNEAAAFRHRRGAKAMENFSGYFGNSSGHFYGCASSTCASRHDFVCETCNRDFQGTTSNPVIMNYRFTSSCGVNHRKMRRQLYSSQRILLPSGLAQNAFKMVFSASEAVSI